MSAGGEQVVWKTPSARLLRLRRLEVCAVGLPCLIVGIAVGSVDGGLLAGVIVAGGILVAGVFGERFVRRRYHAWGYAEREDDLMVRRGVFFSRLSVVPYGRMQFIDVTAGPLERSFGLATVRLHTATSESDARIPGLDNEEAARLRDRLAELGEAQAAGI